MTIKDKIANSRQFVFAFIRSKGYAPDDAEDLTQDTMIKALTYHYLYDERKGKMTSWLARVATHIIIDTTRRKYNKMHFTELAPHHHPVDVYNCENMINFEFLSEVTEKISGPEFKLFIQGYTFKEISAILNENENSCRVRSRRSKIEIREAIPDQKYVQ